MEELASKLSQLDPKVQKFLLSLTEEDVEDIKQGLELARSTVTVGRFLKWSFVGLGGLLLFGTQIWEALEKILKWIRG